MAWKPDLKSHGVDHHFLDQLRILFREMFYLLGAAVPNFDKNEGCLSCLQSRKGFQMLAMAEDMVLVVVELIPQSRMVSCFSTYVI